MSFGQFFNSLYHVLIDNKSFINEFSQLSKVGDRHGMIELIIKIKQADELVIEPALTGKNDEQARKIYNNIKLNHDKSGELSVHSKIEQLTKAFYAADVKNSLYIEIIITRARFWFSTAHYQKCINDCDLAIELMNNFDEYKNKTLENSEQLATMCHVLRNHSTKLINRSKHFVYCSPTKIPHVDGVRNKKLTSCSDALSLVYSSTKGRHLVATKNIKAGTVLIVDEPFAFSTDNQALLTNCLHCHVSIDLDNNIGIPCVNCQTVSFCSEKCRDCAWENYHKYECTIFNNFMDHIHNRRLLQRSLLLLAYRMTVAKAIDRKSNTLDREFLCYQDAKCDEAKKSLEIDINTDSYNPLDYRTVYSLQTHCEKADVKINLARGIQAIFFAKCLVYSLIEVEPHSRETIGSGEIVLLAVALMRHLQAIDCNAYEIVDNFRDEITKTWEPRNIGGAIYTTVSLVNHSCYPNVARHSYPCGKVVVRALRFIGKGSEILDCYGPHFISDPLQSRQQYLLEKYHFVCTCEACAADWKFPLPNEITFRCTCGSIVDSLRSRCTTCTRKVDMKKLNNQLEKSVKKRIVAVEKMFDGDYIHALPLLLEHSLFLDKNLVAPSLEAMKTQQSILQCFNSMANVCKQSTGQIET